MKADDDMRIPAKKLGQLAMPDFCPRRFWIRCHMDREPPFAPFPRIFNDIDGYVKKVVDGWLADRGKAPEWLSTLGEVTGTIPPPKSATFRMPLGEDVTLTGEADGILKLADDTLCIVDFKTASRAIW